MVSKGTMIQSRYVRYGLASVVVLVAAGVCASCVSGSVDPEAGVDTGGQGNGATGNITGQSGSQTGSSGHGGNVTAQGGTGNAQAGTSSTSGGTLGQSGSFSSGGGGASSGGTSTTGGTGSAGSAGKGGTTGMAGATGMAGSGGSGATGPQPLPRITGSQGFATRFWDCCKPSCNGGKVTCGTDGKTQDGGGSACSGGSGYACYSLAPFVDSTNPYVAYAFGATNPQECGACYEIQFTGKAGCADSGNCPANATTLVYNTLYIQGVNTGSDVKSGQFDLMIPGGGVGMFNACSNEWKPNSDSGLGAQNGGFFSGSGSTCNGDVTCYNSKCNSMFSGKPDLLAGCLWFSSWLKAADNPQITYTKVACPQQLRDKSGF